jgi:hypothetical protein
LERQDTAGIEINVGKSGNFHRKVGENAAQ